MSEPYHLRCWTRFYASPEEIWEAQQTLASQPSPVAVTPALDWPDAMPDGPCVRSGDNSLFSSWEHERVLQSASDATRFLDAVTFTTRASNPSADRLVRRLVLELFLRRHRQAARLLPTDRRATAVAVMRAVELELD